MSLLTDRTLVALSQTVHLLSALLLSNKCTQVKTMTDNTFLRTSNFPITKRDGFDYRRLVSEKEVDHNILVINVLDTHPLRRVLQGHV